MVIPPLDIKPLLAYLMLMVIVGGVSLACVKEGKGVDINYEALMYASVSYNQVDCRRCKCSHKTLYNPSF